MAALFVVIDHAIMSVWPDDDRLLYIAWSFGDFGVGIFFVISGFIMAHIAGGAPSGLRPALRFALRRLERIAPLYWIATLLVVAKTPFTGRDMGVSTASFVKSIIFIPYKDHLGAYKPLHGGGWTLNYEMFFYAIFAISLLLSRNSVYLCCAVLAALFISGVMLRQGAFSDSPGNIFEFYSHPLIILFAAGMMFHSVLPKIRPLPPLRHAALLNILQALFCIAIFAVCIKTYPVSPAWRLFAWGACATTVLGTLLFDPKEAAPPQKGLLEFFGDASYSTYLFQIFAFDGVRAVQRHVALPAGLAFCYCVLGAHAVGAAVHLGVEKPILRAFAREGRRAIRQH